MENIEQYKSLLTEVIQKQIVILGPNIAVLKARNVKELKIEDNGTVDEINGDPQAVFQKLMDEYVALSGLIVKNAMDSVLAKYPSLNKKVE
ncbi:MAG: hypothetical protein AAB504_00755 [Patescibacteria group bacterium]